MTNALRRACLPALVALLSACASAPGLFPPAPPGSVSVTHSDPAQFTETRVNPRESAAARQQWLDTLSQHLAEQAALRLPPGQRLEVEILDVRRAGTVEPRLGPAGGDVRIVRDTASPRIDLQFRRLDDGGRLLQEGRRELRNPDFLMGPGGAGSDPLRHEKQLLDDWLRAEFGGRR